MGPSSNGKTVLSQRTNEGSTPFGIHLTPPIEIGAYSYFAETPLVVTYHLNSTKVKVGKFCSIALGCCFLLDSNHNIHRVTTATDHCFTKQTIDTSESKGDIIIENDVWIGVQAMFLSGITVHNGAVVAAGSVVTKDVPPYAVVAGNPAVVKKYRFPPETIQKLLDIAWWDWTHAEIQEAAELLWSFDVDQFVEKYHVRAMKLL